MEVELLGLTLVEALALLQRRGEHPETVCSMPRRLMEQTSDRTPRVVRYRNNTLLYSWFRDAQPEAS